PEIDAVSPQAWFERNDLALLPLFLDPVRSVLHIYQTVAKPWHSRAVTRPGIGHLPANFFNARLLTRSTLLRRQCHLVLGVESRFAVTRLVTRGPKSQSQIGISL